MTKMSKSRRQDLIFQVLKGREQASALSAMDIEKALQNEDIEVDLRTIRRDLDELTKTHGLSSTESRPERYYPAKDYDLKYELHLNENTLQVLLIALNNLKFTSHDYFRSFAAEAETAIFDSLSMEVVKGLRESKSKYYFDFSTSGKPISNNVKDFEKVMVAIRENKVITCNNDSPYKDEAYNQKRRRFAPYMFILTSGIPYLIVEDQDDQKFKKLRATRISNVRLSKSSFEPKEIKDEFHLQSLIGGWGGINDDSIEIEVECDNFMATYFKERNIHQSQKVTQLEEDKYSLYLKCSPSYEIVRLIASYGGHISKIKPDTIKDQVLKAWKDGLKDLS
jgi:predicted DNA-binding transcriptional regulator YafY